MEIDIECPKCNHIFKKNIDDINLKNSNKITEEEREKIRLEGKQEGLNEGEAGRARDKKKYKAELNKINKTTQSSVTRSEKLINPDKGKIAEELLEKYLNAKFPDYPTEPILTGQAGGDIIMLIKEKNELMGSIYFESKKDHPSFQSKWISKLKKDMLRDNADYGVIISSILPASHESDEPYIEYEGGLIYAVVRDKKQNIFAIVDRLAEQIKREYKIKKTDEKRMHNLSDNEKEAVSFVKSENPKLLKELDNEIKKSMNDLDTIKNNHTKIQNLLKKQIETKEETFKSFYEKLDYLDIDGLDLSSVDGLEKNS